MHLLDRPKLHAMTRQKVEQKQTRYWTLNGTYPLSGFPLWLRLLLESTLTPSRVKRKSWAKHATSLQVRSLKALRQERNLALNLLKFLLFITLKQPTNLIYKALYLRRKTRRKDTNLKHKGRPPIRQ